MRVLFAASEIFPFAKTGGLADVAAALPRALAKDIEICSVMPMYAFLDESDFVKEDIGFSVTLGKISYEIELFSKTDNTLKTYFIKAPLLSSSKEIYSDSNDDLRFAIFSMALVELALHVKADTLHLNDWHTALTALFIREKNLDIKTIFTIHNLAYQGVFDYSSLSRIGIDINYFNMDSLEFYGSLNFMKAGIAYSDVVTTVSRRYAKEILTHKFGCGLEGFLHLHRKKLFGILNGIDNTVFDPKTDEALVSNFDKEHISKRYMNKKALLKELKLKEPRKALFAMISRLVQQKGFDILIASIKNMLDKKLNFILIADGDSHYKAELEELALKYENFILIYGYDESLSRRLYASADFLLMPSLFEPCGLNQMIAMRYGAIPVVSAVGGLYDSVHENENVCGRGIVLKPTKKSFLEAIERALKLKSSAKKMRETVEFNMECDFSFKRSAKEYLKLYLRYTT